MSISLCMIAKNEAKNIGAAIDSVKSIVDEIIVVDTGSSDTTSALAKKCGAQVYSFHWNDDFSEARNESLRFATKKWILVLDADEWIAKEDLASLKELAEKGDADAYLLPQLNYTNNRKVTGWRPLRIPSPQGYAGYYTSFIVRLFRNNKGFLFKGKLHELVEESIRQKKGKIEAANIPLHHLGNADPSAVQKKRLLYREIAKKKAAESRDAHSFYELGVIEKELGNEDGARKALEAAVSLDSSHALSHFELGILEKKGKNYQKAIEHFSKSLAAKPTSAAFLERGVCHLQDGNLKKAYANFIKALMLDANNPSIYNNLGIVHERNGNMAEASKMHEISSKLNPASPTAFFNLGNALAKAGEFGRAKEAYEKSISLGHPKKEELSAILSELEGREKERVSIGYSFDVGDADENREKDVEKG